MYHKDSENYDPIFFTRPNTYNSMKNSTAMEASLLYSGDNELFSVGRLGQIEIPNHEGILNYSTECTCPGACRKIFLGLTVPRESSGIAIAIDTDTGAVIDLINDLGIIGFFDNVPMSATETLKIGLEVDLLGSVTIPTIVVNEERMLHPALNLSHANMVLGLGGVALKNASPHTSFRNAKLAMAEEIKPSIS